MGVDLPGAVRRQPADRPTLLTVSRIQERYGGHDVTIRAMGLVRAAIPDVEWVVIGDGPLRPAFEDMVASWTSVPRAVRATDASPATGR